MSRGRRAVAARRAAADDSPIVCVLYLRLSDARRENGTFEAREAKLRARAAQLGWTVLRVVIENDVIAKDGKRRNTASAFKRVRTTLPDGTEQNRVWRPGFRSILADMIAGRAQALLAEDLDRAMRDLYDLEDLVDVVERYGCSAESISGTLRFTRGGTDAEINMARGMVNHANMSSRDTARRVAEGRERTAIAGRWPGGRRVFGFGPVVKNADGSPVMAPDPKTGELKELRDFYALVPEEAEAVVWATDALLGGVPLAACARDLTARGVTTVSGIPFTAEALRETLKRPRNAGLSEYHGEIVGDALWPAIVPRDKWEAVTRLLSQPDRKTGPGPAPKWLGSSLFLCGTCGDKLTVAALYKNPRKSASYCCRRRHVRRRVDWVDEWVETLVVRRLKRPDAAELLVRARGRDVEVDVGALRARAAELHASRKSLTVDKALTRIDQAAFNAGCTAINLELDAIQEKLAAVAGNNLLAPLMDADDAAAAWAELSLGQRREVLRRVMKVTILPVGRHSSGTVLDKSGILVEDPD